MRRKTNVYEKVMEFKRKYPLTVAFRLKKHCRIVEEFLNSNESVLYAFCGQKNDHSYMLCNTSVIVVTTKRLLIGHKRFIGHLYTSITPDLFNDLKVNRSIIWGSVQIDTVKEFITLTNIDPNALDEIETNISKFMLEEKKKFGIRN